ncbi:hypothetical protein BGZ65_002062 [Modicella reniformis]|uniref:Uncharacterized protein n=1 Tax=Modicella reniformis TaxID=1440133 RepID=A0A9P6ILI7_9FUNG|nr:hypothetical protein BGZ65_002062 [Modicella reniformis]
MSPEVHLAKHEGYDLDRPKEFFERYGSYVLALLYMVKFGITAARLVIPPLAASLKILEGLVTTHELNNFFRITKSTLPPSSKLRVFSLQSGLPFKAKTKSLDIPFEYCSTLTALELKFHYPRFIAKVVHDTFSKLNKLESLKIYSWSISVTIRALGGKIQDVKTRIKYLHGLGSDDLKFLEDDLFTDLAIEYGTNESLLAGIIRRAPNLKHFQIGRRCQPRTVHKIIDCAGRKIVLSADNQVDG